MKIIFVRYAGYCAWRGVLDFSKNENSEAIMCMRKAYPELGKCMYCDLGSGTHAGFYELPRKRLNWIWYINQPEPGMKVINEITYPFIFFHVVTEFVREKDGTLQLTNTCGTEIL